MLILIVQKGTRPYIFQPWFGYIDFHGRKSRWPHHNKSLLYLTISLLACGHPFQFKTVWKYLRFLISLFNERRPWVSYFKHSAPGMQLFRRSAVHILALCILWKRRFINSVIIIIYIIIISWSPVNVLSAAFVVLWVTSWSIPGTVFNESLSLL